MYAEVLCVGPFHPDLVEFYQYSAEAYAHTEPGKPIVTILFGLTEGSPASREFAARLGISDAWDFNQHKIDPSNIDLPGLEKWSSTLDYSDEYLRDFAALAAFIAHDYDLYFLPNG